MMNRASPGKRAHSRTLTQRQIEKAQTPRIPVAGIHGIIELDNAERKKIHKRHPCQADIQRPERYFSRAIAPSVGMGQVTQTEEQKPDGQHAVNAHHGGVAVIGGQRGADFIVAYDRKID